MIHFDSFTIQFMDIRGLKKKVFRFEDGKVESIALAGIYTLFLTTMPCRTAKANNGSSLAATSSAGRSKEL